MHQENIRTHIRILSAQDHSEFRKSDDSAAFFDTIVVINNTLGSCSHLILHRLPNSALILTLSSPSHGSHLFTNHILCAQSSLPARQGCGHSHHPSAVSPPQKHGISHSRTHLTWPHMSLVSNLREGCLCSQ